MQPMYYISLDVHKRKIGYCGKDSSGHASKTQQMTGESGYMTIYMKS